MVTDLFFGTPFVDTLQSKPLYVSFRIFVRAPASENSILSFCSLVVMESFTLGLSTPGHSSAFRKFYATQLNGPGWEFEDVQHDISQLQACKPVCVIGGTLTCSSLSTFHIRLFGTQVWFAVFTCLILLLNSWVIFPCNFLCRSRRKIVLIVASGSEKHCVFPKITG